MASTACGRRFDPQLHRSTPIAELVATVQSTALPDVTQATHERLRRRSLLSGRMDLSKEGICKAMELPRTTTGEGDIGYRGQRAQGRGEPGYLRLGQPQHRVAWVTFSGVGSFASWAIVRRRFELWSGGEFVAAEGQLISAPSVRV